MSDNPISTPPPEAEASAPPPASEAGHHAPLDPSEGIIRASPFEGAETVDLSLGGVVRLLVTHWRENVVARRVWKRVRPWALVLLLIDTLPIATGFYEPNFMTFNAQFVFLMALSCLTSILALAVWIAVPLVYGKWSYRWSYRDDAVLRSSPLTLESRVMGIVIPAMMLALVSSLGTIVLGSVQVAVGIPEMLEFFPEVQQSLVGVFLVAIAYAISTSLMVLLYGMFIVTAGFRHILRDAETGFNNGRKWPSVAAVYLANVLLGILAGLVMLIPYGIAGGLIFSGVMVIDSSFMFTLLSIGFIAVSAVFLVPCYYTYFLVYRDLFLKKDLPLIAQCLFDSQSTVLIKTKNSAPE